MLVSKLLFLAVTGVLFLGGASVASASAPVQVSVSVSIGHDHASSAVDRVPSMPVSPVDMKQYDVASASSDSAPFTVPLSFLTDLKAFSVASESYLKRFDSDMATLANNRQQPKIVPGQVDAAARVFAAGLALTRPYDKDNLSNSFSDYTEVISKMSSLLQRLKGQPIPKDPTVATEFITGIRAAIYIFRSQIFHLTDYIIPQITKQRKYSNVQMMNRMKIKSEIDAIRKELDTNYRWPSQQTESQVQLMRKYGAL
jgi:hypothetical protein